MIWRKSICGECDSFGIEVIAREAAPMAAEQEARPGARARASCSRSSSSSRRRSSAAGAWSDPPSTRRPRPTPGLVARPGPAARLASEPSQALDDSNPPFFKWFADGTLNASAQLPRPPRRGRPGERVASTGAARRGGARRHLRRATRRRAALRQRAEGPRDRQGRRGRDLPADDPRGRRRDAGLRPDRRDPQRRLRRLLGRGGARADGVLPRQGAGHRRRRPRKGKTGAVKPRSTSGWATVGSLETIVIIRPRRRVPVQRGPRRLQRRGVRGRRADCPPEPIDAERPLFIL